MVDTHSSFFNKSRFKISALVVLGLLVLARVGYSEAKAGDSTSAILQGTIRIQPVVGGNQERIQPGTPVKFKVMVENKGEQASPSGQIFLRYAFAKPMQNETGSIIFESEKKDLPSIEAGKEIEMSFDLAQELPSISDFVRDDWALREYQAVVEIYKESRIIGTLALTFSAYYYPGITKQFSAKF
jgi:hypothetical protein